MHILFVCILRFVNYLMYRAGAIGDDGMAMAAPVSEGKKWWYLKNTKNKHACEGLVFMEL